MRGLVKIIQILIYSLTSHTLNLFYILSNAFTVDKIIKQDHLQIYLLEEKCL